MREQLKRFLAPPVFSDDEDKTRAAAVINAIAWSIILIVAVIIMMRVLQGQDSNLVSVNLVLGAAIAASGTAVFLSRQGSVRGAGMILVATLWVGLSSVAWIADGIRDVTFFGYIIPILLAGLLHGWRGAIFVVVASILSGWALAYAEVIQLIRPTSDTALHFARDITAILILVGILIYLTISSLERALHASRVVARQLARTNENLDTLRLDLERHVEERTYELKQRAAQFEAISDVARTIAAVQDIDTLLPAIADIVGQRFGYYQVGIFLLDEGTNRVVLRASSSEGGRLLVSENFSLSLDQDSIVARSIRQGEPRIVSDVTSDPVYLHSPHLSETRSEIALPLRIGERVIGSLDVQSEENNAFSGDDMGLLATLADQIAIAIENARSFGEARAALRESQALFRKYTQQEWRSFTRQAKSTGFLFNGNQVLPLERNLGDALTSAAIQTGSLSLEKETASIAVPLKLRGQIIGVLDVRAKNGVRLWKQEEISMLEAAAERAALALETARLVESAQRRAARERAIGDISARIGAVSGLDSILQAAVEELGRRIGGAAEVTLALEDDPDRQASVG